MVSGGIFGTSRKSRVQRSYLKGSLFFLLLHMFHGTTGETTTPVATTSSTTTPVATTSSTTTPVATTSSTTTPVATTSSTTTPVATTSSTTTPVATTSSTTTPVATTSSTTTPVATSFSGIMTSASSANTSPITNNMTLSANMSTGNTSSSGNDTMLSCPAFNCTTDCYAKFMNKTTTPCPSASSNCELIKQGMSYSIICSVSCGMSCGNATLSNCSLACCNTTSCLNNSLLAISSSLSTTAPTKPSTTATTIKVTVPLTPANNGKKCLSIKCDGAACYKNTNSFRVMYCPVGQEYCMLNKVTVGTAESWQGGCSGDCRKAQACSTGLTTCYLECCNATTAASCLKLTGDLNMPSSATRGPHSPGLLTASLLLLWMVKILT